MLELFLAAKVATKGKNSKTAVLPVFFLNRTWLRQQASNVAATVAVLPAKNLLWQTWQQKYSWKQDTVKTQGRSVKPCF